MITKTRRWRLVAAALVALGVPASATPAYAAPAEVPDVATLLKLQAKLVDAIGGKPTFGATGVDDGYPGGYVLSAGADSSCSAASEVSWCWGAGEAEPAKVAADIVPGPVAAGRAHTCELEFFNETDDGGDLYCWGDNAEGQVGDGTTTTRTEPVKVASSIREVAAGTDHTCAIQDDATVRCWGRNDVGQLGTGSAGVSESSPQTVTGLTDVIDLAAGGDTTCAIDDDGDAWCWGSDTEGQLGDGSVAATPVATPTAVVMTDIDDELTQLDVGRAHACAVTSEGDVWCWGSDTSGQLGDGAPAAEQSRPVEVGAAEETFQVSAGGDSTCAIAAIGQAYCWGANDEGQLGVGDRIDRDEPAEVDQSAVPESTFLALLTGMKGSLVLQVTVGDAHACALDIQGNAFCWGNNADGQVGDGTTTDRLTPVATLLAPGVVTDLNVTAGDAELGVTWSPPAELGVGELQSYGVLAIGESFGPQCITKTPGCTISGLDNGVEYQVIVATVTDGGFSVSAAVPAIPLGHSASPVPVSGGGGSPLPITGAAVSLLILLGGGLVLGGIMLRRT